MGNDVEKTTGKPEADVKEVVKNSDTKVEVEPKTTSEVSEDKAEDIIKSQTGIIQSLQKQVKELSEKPDIKDVLKDLLGEENTDADVVTVDTVKTQLDSLKSELARERAINARNTYIDSKEDLTDAEKRYLKSEITETENIEEVVEKKIGSLRELLQNQTPQANDSRPDGLGGGTPGGSFDADFVKAHPEIYNK